MIQFTIMYILYYAKRHFKTIKWYNIYIIHLIKFNKLIELTEHDQIFSELHSINIYTFKCGKIPHAGIAKKEYIIYWMSVWLVEFMQCIGVQSKPEQE